MGSGWEPPTFQDLPQWRLGFVDGCLAIFVSNADQGPIAHQVLREEKESIYTVCCPLLSLFVQTQPPASSLLAPPQPPSTPPSPWAPACVPVLPLTSATWSCPQKQA